jgi:cold shock CspA family protein
LQQRPLQGVIESYDANKGYEFIRSSEGEPVLLHVTCLRAAGKGNAPRIVAQVEFEEQGLAGFRLFSLEGAALA